MTIRWHEEKAKLQSLARGRVIDGLYDHAFEISYPVDCAARQRKWAIADKLRLKAAGYTVRANPNHRSLTILAVA